MDELKKIYLRVKSVSNEFKNPLGECFTGNDLYATIVKFQSVYQADQVKPEDAKWVNKLINYLEPFPKA